MRDSRGELVQFGDPDREFTEYEIDHIEDMLFDCGISVPRELLASVSDPDVATGRDPIFVRPALHRENARQIAERVTSYLANHQETKGEISS